MKIKNKENVRVRKVKANDPLTLERLWSHLRVPTIGIKHTLWNWHGFCHHSLWSHKDKLVSY